MPIRTGNGPTAWSRIGPDGRPDPVRRVLTFTSAPLASDIEITGPIVLELHASSDQIDTRFIVKLADQAPQEDAARATGRAARLHQRLQRAGCKPRTARRIRPARPQLRPFYTHTNPQPLTPGEIYRFDIEMLPIAYRVQEGSSHPAGDRQWRLAADRRRLHPSLSADCDRNRHDPPRPHAPILPAAAAGEGLVGRGVSVLAALLMTQSAPTIEPVADLPSTNDGLNPLGRAFHAISGRDRACSAVRVGTHRKSSFVPAAPDFSHHRQADRREYGIGGLPARSQRQDCGEAHHDDLQISSVCRPMTLGRLRLRFRMRGG